MSYDGQGKTIKGNRLRISGTGHFIVGNFNIVSGTGHVINGNGNKISGTGHVVNGSNNQLSGSGYVVNGKIVSGGPSSIASFTTARSNGKIVKSQFNVGGIVSNVFGSSERSFGINVCNNENIRNSFNFAGNNVQTVVAGNGTTITTVVGGGGTIDVTLSNEEDDVSIFVNENRFERPVRTVGGSHDTGIYDVNDKCKIPGEDASTLDEEISSNEDNDKDACKVCFERKRRCLVRPCNHYILCITCSRTIGLGENPKCPECMGFADSFEIVCT